MRRLRLRRRRLRLCLLQEEVCAPCGEARPQAPPPAKKAKKGLSVEEKRAVMLDILLSSGEVFNLKDLEKLGARAGVVEKTVKEVVESLVADKAVEVDKIGAGNFYWAFPSAVVLNIKNAAAALAADAAKENAAAAAAEARVAELSVGRADSAARAASLAALEAARAERAALDAQLKAYAESDPDALAELQAKARAAKVAADRWTDNVWALKAYLTGKFGKSPAECDAMMGIPDDFDYVA